MVFETGVSSELSYQCVESSHEFFLIEGHVVEGQAPENPGQIICPELCCFRAHDQRKRRFPVEVEFQARDSHAEARMAAPQSRRELKEKLCASA